MDTSIDAISTVLNEVRPGTAEYMALTQEQKEIKRLAKRILKTVKDLLEDAFRKEADLKGLERDEIVKRLDALPIFAATKALELEDPSPVKKGTKHRRSASQVSAVAGASPEDEDEEMPDADLVHELPRRGGKKSTPTSEATGSRASSRHSKTASLSKAAPVAEPLSPPTSASSSASAPIADEHDVFAQGGVPWYLEQFDPVGTTVHEERYTGREVLRGMSEELSDMDEDTLTELKVSGSLAEVETPRRSTRGQVAASDGKEKDKVGVSGGGSVEGKGGQKRPKKKGKKSQWSRPRVR